MKLLNCLVKMHTLQLIMITKLICISMFVLVINISKTDATTNQIKQFLGPHNAVRSALGMKPLIWDGGVARYAEWYANQRRYDCELKHSNGPYGENIFWGSGNEWTPSEAVTAWVSEKTWYNYWSNSCGSGQQCGHYTQIVWRSTRKLGCARVVCFGGRGVFITCNYDPPGNYVGEKPY